MHLYVRADADEKIGTGHIMRCLALAQAWQDNGGKVTFISRCESEAPRKRITAEKFDLISLEKPYPEPFDIAFTIDTVNKLSTRYGSHSVWVVVDGYHFDARYQKSIKDAGYKLLWVDDYGHADHYWADIVLNQNISADPSSYMRREHYTELLLGTRYVLLRRAFRHWQRLQLKQPPVAQRFLVTMGGGDHDDVIMKVIEALKRVDIPGVEAKIVIGRTNRDLELLESEIGVNSNFKLIMNAANMPELMASADAAVSAGGSTCWELAYMGVPSMLLHLAENQIPTVRELGSKGIALNLGNAYNLDPARLALEVERLGLSTEMRTEMSRRGRMLVDGYGVDRVMHRMRSPVIKLRPVDEGDCRRIWEWANDKTFREASFSQAPIGWEEHVAWFREKLHDPKCHFYIALDEEERPIGQVRFNQNEAEAVISFGLDPKFRRKGYGTAIIEISSREVERAHGANGIHAYIKYNNERSIRAFLKAGFTDAGQIKTKDHNAVHLILQAERQK